MKKYLVIGNPIDHSLSPKLHNYWLKQNNINAVYDKIKLEENEIKEIIQDIKKKNSDIYSINIFDKIDQDSQKEIKNFFR